jgi:predicted CxxxxCH...CXXCH cytochrome family protein
LLRQTNNDALCTSCHTLGIHNGMSCSDCHKTHNTSKDNIYMIKDNIVTPNSGTRSVVFSSLTGNGSFADNDADGNSTWDGVCEACHTTAASSNHHNFEAAPTEESNHYSGQDCTGCHPHSSNFSPSGGGCTGCHDALPTFNSAVHIKHKDTYGFACNTCHNGYGSGGSLESTHPSGGSANIAFDPGGMATRNGLDAITPIFNGDKTCDNIYCHSNGKSADRGTDATNTWGDKSGPGLPFGGDPLSYETTPIWTTGSITACTACHGGISSLPPGPTYDITAGDGYNCTSIADMPNTGGHGPITAQHASGNEANWGAGTTQCFFCHDTDDRTATGGVKKQGTYGTSFHVDGETHFKIDFYPNGTGNVSIPRMEAGGHCSGKNCWSGG